MNENENEVELGIPNHDDVRTALVRDVFLQLAGMEGLSGIGPFELQPLANEIAKKRSVAVVERLGSAVDLAGLGASGQSVSIAALEERVPYAAILITFHTAALLAGAWQMIEDEVRRQQSHA